MWDTLGSCETKGPSAALGFALLALAPMQGDKIRAFKANFLCFCALSKR